MKRLAIHPFFRRGLIVLGTVFLLCSVVLLSRWLGYKRTESVIGVEHIAYKDHGAIVYDANRIRMRGTNPVLVVGFVRSTGTAGGVVQPELSLPANAKPGDHVIILYREEWGNDADAAFIYSFNLVWGKPIGTALIGVLFICLGLLFRNRAVGMTEVSTT